MNLSRFFYTIEENQIFLLKEYYQNNVFFFWIFLTLKYPLRKIRKSKRIYNTKSSKMFYYYYIRLEILSKSFTWSISIKNINKYFIYFSIKIKSKKKKIIRKHKQLNVLYACHLVGLTQSHAKDVLLNLPATTYDLLNSGDV